MLFTSLIRRQDGVPGSKLTKAYDSFEQLIRALERKSIPSHVIGIINMDIDDINSFVGSDLQLAKVIRRIERHILKRMEKDFKLVVRNHYRRAWLVAGMTVIGIPFGLLLGAGTENVSYLAIGIPVGMLIELIIGGTLDKRAKDLGKQLDFTMA